MEKNYWDTSSSNWDSPNELCKQERKRFIQGGGKVHEGHSDGILEVLCGEEILSNAWHDSSSHNGSVARQYLHDSLFGV